jgi:transmembrane sensor
MDDLPGLNDRIRKVRENAAAIDAAAADWVVRLDRGLTEIEQEKLDTWLAADGRRRGAFARAQAAWLHADRATAFHAAAELRAPAAGGRREALRWTAAAAVIVSLAVSFIGWQAYTRTHLATARGEIRKDSLADGSYITLDTRSSVSVQFESKARIVSLESGEALFEVAKDSARPFVVHAGNVRVRAIGTAFVVRRRSDDEVEVTVTKGVVTVWRETTNAEPSTRLVAGARTVITPEKIDHPVELTEMELARAVAWKTGIINLDGRTLGDAAAEFNRYNRQTVVIADAALAGQKVVGRFEVSDPRAFVSAAAAMLDAHVRTEGERLILEAGRNPAQSTQD